MNIRGGGDAVQSQAAFVLGAEEADRGVNASLAGGAKSVEVGASPHSGRGSEGDSFHDVAAATDAAITDQLDTITDGIGDVGEKCNRGGRAFELATTVVRKCESIHTEVGCDLCVLDALDSLDHDWSVPLGAELFEVRPAEGCVELGSGELREGDGFGTVAKLIRFEDAR